MAVIMTDASYMGFPLSIKRGNPAPVDTTAVWYAKADLETYAKSGATAYVGQILTLVANGKCEAYMISNEAGTLIKLASTTASGDLSSDVATLQTQVADLISKVGTDGENATGLYKEIDDVLKVANAKVASVTAGDKSITVGGTSTAPTIAVTISKAEGNILSLDTDGLKAVVTEVKVPEYSVTKKADSGDYSAVYQLTKDGVAVGADINIPKDMVVKSGSVETYSAGALPTGVTEAGTYIVLVLANATNDKLYIKANDLIEYVTSGSETGDMVFVNIDPTTHKVTATITDGTVTKAKLHSDVQTSLGKADSAIQSVVEGTVNGAISVDGTSVKVHGLADGAYATVASLNSTAKGYADAVETKLLGGEDDTSESTTIAGAKKYADSKASSVLNDAKSAITTEIGKLDVEDKAVANQFVTVVSEADGKIAVTRRALATDDIPELAQTKITGLSDALGAKQDSLVFDGTYNASTNKVATVNTVNTAVSGVVSNGKDVASDDTVKGAKLYADSKASGALADAKAYADGLVTGDSGITKRVDSLEEKVDVTKVSTAISTAKDEAISTASSDATSKVNSAKTALLGEEGYEGTIKGAYASASSAKSVADSAQTDATKALADAKTADDKAVSAQNDVDTLETLVGTLPTGATSKTVVGYIDEQIGKIPAQIDYTVTCDATTPAGVAKRYTFSQKGSAIATIDIPKDMVVESGTVETKAEAGVWGKAGTYLVLTLANATNDKIYINAGDLIEYVTGGNDSEGIITTSVSADHVLTAKLNDGKVTKAKLAKAVQDSLALADSAIQEAGLETKLEGYVAKETGKRLMTTDEGTKLDGIATGAQVNKIESVKVGGTALSIGSDKSVNIAEISTDLLKNGSNVLVLNCGTASDEF